MEFLHPSNEAGQTLLVLVARGNAIIAEMLRLSDHIPSVFLGIHDIRERQKYTPILFDFSYLKNAEAYDSKIDADPDVVDLDEEFRENHMALLERFYKLFESIYKYINDWITYVNEMIEGVFVQHTVEGVLLDVEGRQLMCEALYLYGVMLLLLDVRIPGITRERMIVSFYRYKGAATIPNIEDVCKLCRSTGFFPGGKRPLNYPEEFFARFKLQGSVVEMIIGRLRSDDIYNHTSAYPHPSHRSTALATQSAMLYVILYFAPNSLHNKTSVMREVVDKHFQDNWVVPFFMGFSVDLADAWEPYKAAKTALANTLAKQNVTEITAKHAGRVQVLNEGLEKFLTEGTLIDDYVLDNIRKLLIHVRNCNVTLRWFLLHRTTTNKKLKEAILAIIKTGTLMKLLMNTAQFEFLLKSQFKRLLDSKQARWEEAKTEASGRMIELAEYFSGTKELTRVKPNEKLQAWFRQLSAEISGLDFHNTVLAGRKVAQLNQALEDVEEFHQIEASLQVKQFLGETREYLSQMIRTANMTAKVLGDLDIISDFSYAWDLINDYTGLLHERIKKKPSIVLLLRATFLKLASILSLPLVRITQCESKDDVSVAEYYSSQLVKYVRGVLEVIPQSVFTVLDEIIHLMTHDLKPIPTKVERKYLKDLCQLDMRGTLAKATHQVSVFTQGVLAMNYTLMGIIKLDPRQLLEEGIRKELVRQIATALNDDLLFRTGKVEDFELRLNKLGHKLDGFKQSFEYIQDYINVYGLKIWQEEFSRIINYNVEQESNQFLKRKVYDWQSTYQSDAIPIPVFPSEDKQSMNFMGRLAREVLAQSDCRRTVYVESLQGWYDEKMKEIVGIRTFSLLHKGVGTFGLTGMDRLICFMIVRDLTDFVRLYRRTVSKPVKDFVLKLCKELHPTSQFPRDCTKLYAAAKERTHKLWPVFLEFVTKIGQSQLIRRQIANELNFSCKLDSKILSCTLDVMNRALIGDIKAHYTRPDSKPYPGNPVLADLTKYLDTAGMTDPTSKIYITTEPLEGLPVLMFLFVLSQLPRFDWNEELSTLVCTEKHVALDGAPFVLGVLTIMKQFHSSHTYTFLAYLGQYVRATVSSSPMGARDLEIPSFVRLVLLFMEEFCKFSFMPRTAIDAVVPSYIFDRFKHSLR